MIAETLLAIMLELGTPGRSVYSLVPVPQDSPRACADRASLLCAAPRFDAWHKSFVRPETWSEGLARWWTIAQALEQTTQGDELQAVALTAIWHESGFRRDVHSGIGASARGDHGRSWCLGQIMLGDTGRRKVAEGWEALELVGVAQEPTRRCLTVVSRYVAAAAAACHGATDGRCLFTFYGGGRALANPQRIEERRRTLDRVRALRPVLELEARDALGL